MKKYFLVWFMETSFYKFLLLKVVPFIRFSMYYTRLRGNKYHEGWQLLQPGHIVLTIDDKKLTGMLIGGFMSHAALCLAKRDISHEYEIAEMTHTNFTYSDFFDICKEASRVLIINCEDWDKDYKGRVVKAAHSLHNAKYDIEFELGVEALYCSELVLQADKIAYQSILNELDVSSPLNCRLKVDLSDLAGLGRPYISPDGLLFAKNVRVVWDSDGQFASKLGPEVEAILQL